MKNDILAFSSCIWLKISWDCKSFSRQLSFPLVTCHAGTGISPLSTTDLILIPLLSLPSPCHVSLPGSGSGEVSRVSWERCIPSTSYKCRHWQNKRYSIINLHTFFLLFKATKDTWESLQMSKDPTQLSCHKMTILHRILLWLPLDTIQL